MTELEAKLIAWAIVLGANALVMLLLIGTSLISSYKEKRIRKYLLSIGYKRELISTDHTYGYTKSHSVIHDYELKGMSLKKIKEKYK